MELTSLAFLSFFFVLLVLFYVLPRRFRPTLLMGAGLLYLFSAVGISLFPAAESFFGLTRRYNESPYSERERIFQLAMPVLTTLTAYAACRILTACRKTRAKTAVLVTALVLVLFPLIYLKYTPFGQHWGNPPGLSFYTFTLTALVVAVYQGRMALPDFVSFWNTGLYFPTLVSGPIRGPQDPRFAPAETTFCWDTVLLGMQRMLWGFFKKLVVAERCGVAVAAAFGGGELTGWPLMLGAVLFSIQLYADFSGLMDLVLGATQCLGLELPENFRQPFFSGSIPEYWRRWHITLGAFLRENIFYPLLMSPPLAALGKRLRGRIGRKKANQAVNALAMLVLWFTVGAWHGAAWHFIIGVGLLHWVYIQLGEHLAPVVASLLRKIRIPTEGKGADLFRVLRTFALVTVGHVFFRAKDVPSALSYLGRSFVFSGSLAGFRASEYLGTDLIDWILLILSVLILFGADLYREKRGEDLRQAVGRRPLVLRWIIWYGLILWVVLFGLYGPGYSAGEFIYQGF